MRRRDWNLLLDWALLLAGLTAFSTGIVFLFRFHVGEGPFATSALGLDRLVWLNLHRLSAALVLAVVATHVALHFRTFKRRVTALFARQTRRRDRPELLLYLVFLIAVSTGFAAWWIVEGSSPLLGPAILGRASASRHPWVDTHHVSSLVALALVAHHIGHRRRFLVPRTAQGAGRASRASSV